MTKFINARLLIADYYASLRSELDIYTEELLEKLPAENTKLVVDSSSSLPNAAQTLEALNNSMPIKSPLTPVEEPLVFIETAFNDPYTDKYTFENEKNTNNSSNIAINNSTLIKDYANSIRANAIRELKEAEEENLKYLELHSNEIKYDRNDMDENKIEILRSQVFASKFCFVLNTEGPAKRPNNTSVFKRSTIFLDFYLNQKEIDFLQTFISGQEHDDEEDKSVSITLDEKQLLVHLIWKYMCGKFANSRFGNEIIRLDKKRLVSIEKINYEHYDIGIDVLNLDGSILNLSGVKSIELSPRASVLNSINLSGLSNLEYLSLWNVALDQSPFLNLTKLRRLTLTGFFKSQLDPNILANLVSLEILTINYSKNLVELSSSGLESLKWLQLRNNQVEHFNSPLFQHLNESLLILDLSSNSINDTGMRHLKLVKTPKLRILNLDSNRLESFVSDWFSELTSLKKLILSSNSIAQLDLTNGLCNLDILDLKKNKIETLPASFASLKSLKSLDLSSNQISSIGDNSFNGLINLETLYLNMLRTFNKLENANSFVGLSNLTKLELQHNNLLFIEPGVFNALPNLLELNLCGNSLELDERTFSALKNLKSLNLSYNWLASLKGIIFASLSKLESLDLSMNEIEDLADDLFLGPDKSLKWLSLSRNKLRNFNFKILENKLMRMERIELSENPIEKEQAFLLASMSRVQIIIDY